VRFSAGLEDPGDLVADLHRALDVALDGALDGTFDTGGA
jgi:hypothetical protein